MPLATTAAALVHIDADELARYQRWLARQPRGRSGFGRGQPQCRSCRRILSAYGAACPSCGGFGWDR